MEKLNLFGRARKETKLRTVQNMTTQELLSISDGTFQRILKETGEGTKGTRSRRLRLPGRPGNDWNSEVEEIYRTSGAKIYLSVYHQLSHTDITKSVLLSEFLSPGDWRGASEEMDRWGGKTTKYCVYSPGYKAEVIREILKTYLDLKYPDA